MGQTNSKGKGKGMLCGLVVGGLAVGACVALFTSKAGKKLRGDIAENCEDFGEKIEDFFGSLKENVKNDFHDRVDNLSEKTKDAMQYVRDGIGSAASLENKDFKNGLFVGGVLGVLLTIGGTMMYKASFEDSEQMNMFNNFGQHACKWKKIIKDVLENSDEPTRSARDESKCGHHINDVLDFATLGVRLWKNMKNNR